MAIGPVHLPYELNGLEPALSKMTLNYHYGKHHLGYLNKLNKLILDTPYDDMSLEEIVSGSWAGQSSLEIFQNSAQLWNHSFYWKCLHSGGQQTPSMSFLAQLSLDFGSLQQFHLAFKAAAKNVFGSGWLWLVQSSTGKMEIIALKDADCPLTKKVHPLLTCDLWEHAYYLDYQNNRDKYIDAFIERINWQFVESNYKPPSFQERPRKSPERSPEQRALRRLPSAFVSMPPFCATGEIFYKAVF